MNLLFRKLTIENFKSIGSIEIDFLDPAIAGKPILVLGKNLDNSPTSNGSGKSSIAECMYWIIYGKTPPPYSAKANNVINDQVNKNTRGRLEVDIDGVHYVFSRHRSHEKYGDSLVFEQDGKETIFHSQSDATENMAKIWNMTELIYQSTVHLPQTLPTKFSSASKQGRYDIIKDVVLSNVWDLAGNKCKAELDKLSTSEIQIKAKLDLLTNQGAVHLSREAQLNLEINSLSGEENPEELQQHIDECKANYEALLKKRAEFEEEATYYDKQLNNIGELLFPLDQEFNLLTERLGFLRNAECPTCQQSMNALQEEIPNLEQTLQSNRERYQTYHQIHNQHLSNRYNAQEQVMKFAQQAVQENSRLNLLTSKFNTASTKKSVLEAQLLETTSQMEKVKVDIHLLREDLLDVRSKKKVHEELYRVLSKTIKASLLEEAISYLNSFLVQYSPILYKECTIMLDSEKKGNPHLEIMKVYHDGHKRPYSLFSGGERQRVDLMIPCGLVSILDMIHNFSSNIIFFDEIFDSLDAPAAERYLTLIQELFKNKTLFIISHNEQLKEYIPNVLQVVKQNKISSLVNHG